MDQKLLFTLLCFLSWTAFTKHHESTGCANLAYPEEIAIKIALIRAKASWVEHHYGGVVSGRETLLLDNDTTQLALTIKIESVGRIESQSVLQVTYDKRVKNIDGKPHLCIYFATKK